MGKQARARAARRAGNTLWNALRRDGVQARVVAAHSALNSEAFVAGFRAALGDVTGTEREPKNEADVCAIARPILEQMGTDLRDVVITLEWQPHFNRTIVWRCRPDPAAVRRAQEQLQRAA